MLQADEVSDQVCGGFKVARTHGQCACVALLYSDYALKQFLICLCRIEQYGLPNGVSVGSQLSDSYNGRRNSFAKAVLAQQNNSRRTARLAVGSGALSV